MMDNNINSVPSNADNSLMLNAAKHVDDAKNNQVDFSANKQTSIDTQASADNINVLISAEKINTENKKDEKQKKDASEDDINKALGIVSSFMNNSNKQVAFSNDNSNGKTVITITDKETQEVINQFPSEKIISMAERIQDLHREAESISGLLIDSHV